MNVDKSMWKTAEDLVSYARSKGADQAQVKLQQGDEFSVSVQQGKIDKLTEAGSRTASIKLIKAERVINVSSSDLDAATLRGLIDRSLERVVLLSPDPYSALPELEPVPVEPASLKIYDEAIEALSPREKIDRAFAMESIALADKRVKKSNGAGVSSYAGAEYLANSNGFSGAYRKTSISCNVFLQAGDGDNLFDEGKGDFARSLRDLMPPEEVAREAVHRVTRMIGAEKIPSENMPVVFERDQAAMILGFLSDCVDGDNVFRRKSFLAGRIGEKIGADSLTIIDDGLLPSGPGSKPFDTEGVPARRTIVVEKGVLKSYLLNTYAARKLEMNSTGNGSGANNLYIRPGPHSPEEIIGSVKRGLLLTDTMAFGLETATGNISKGAFGMLIENGEVTRPVAEITISSTLGEVLKNVAMIGNDLEHDGSIVSPTLLVSEVSIGGK